MIKQSKAILKKFFLDSVAVIKYLGK